MRRLDGFSAFMVYNDVARCYQHTLKIAILDWADAPQGYSYSALLEHIEKGLAIFPMLKWKLARVPFGLNHPVWVEDLEFELSQQVRRIACPAPGDRKALSEVISEIYAHPLDKSRPLWQAWVIEGLEHDRVALVTLFHHAYCDGAGAALLLRGLVAPESFPPKSSRDYGVDPRKNPGWWRLLFRGLLDLPLIFARELPPLLVTAVKQNRQTRDYRSQGKLLPPSPKDAPDSPLNTVHSHGRTFTYLSFTLADVKGISRHFEVTFNDFLVAIVAGAVRRYYLDHHLPPDEPLVANIPINKRTEAEQQEVLGNHVTNSYISLPIHLDDPVERLIYASRSGHAMKDQMAAIGGEGLLRAVELTPPIATDIMNWMLRRAKGQLKLFGNIAISNVRGPTEYMYLAGARVEKWLSIGQVVAGVGLNITAWSYSDQFNVCLMADKKVVSDGELFLDYLLTSYDEYRALAEQIAAPDSSMNEAGRKP